MDTSPLLRQMLEEQGIAREHLERVSDSQSIPGMSDHLSDSHSATSKHSRSQPHSQATSPNFGPSSYGRSPPTDGLHLPPGQILQQRPPLYGSGGGGDSSG